MIHNAFLSVDVICDDYNWLLNTMLVYFTVYHTNDYVMTQLYTVYMYSRYDFLGTEIVMLLGRLRNNPSLRHVSQAVLSDYNDRFDLIVAHNDKWQRVVIIIFTEW